MATLADKYQFWAVTDMDSLTPVQELHPLNSSIEWNYRRPDACLFFRKELDTALIFANNVGKGLTDFDYLYGKEREAPCNVIGLLIKRKCDGVWADYWKGRMYCVDGTWDVSNCRVEISARVHDKYSCLLDTWEEDIDLAQFTGIPRINARTAIGETQIWAHQEVTTGGTPPDFNQWTFGPGGPGWKLWLQLIRQFGNSGTWENRVHFIREVYRGATQPPGSGWLPDSSLPGWARPVKNFSTRNSYGVPLSDIAPPPGTSGAEFNRWEKILRGNIDQVFTTFKHGISLAEVFDWSLKCNVGGLLRSRFFDINPGGAPAPVNQAYTYAATNLNNIVLWQSSDVARPDATNPAKTFKIRLKDLITNLNAAFNVWWMVDDDGYLRIEHISYWQQQQTVFDLTNSKFLKGSYQYSYDDIPRGEDITWNQDVSPWFAHPGITYLSDCASGERITLTADILTPDFQKLFMDGREIKYRPNFEDYEDGETTVRLTGPPGYNGLQYLFSPKLFDFISDSDNVTDIDMSKWAGFYIANVAYHDGEAYIPTFTVPVYYTNGGTSYDEVNGALSLASMLLPLHRHYRWADFYIDGVNNYVTAHSPKRPRVTQTAVVIPLCCGDPYDEHSIFQTLLGKGSQEEIKHSEPLGALTITLKY